MKACSPVPYLRKHKRRILTGAVLAAAAALICAIWYDPADGLAFAAAFLAAGLVNLDSRFAPVRFLLNGCWGAVCIFLSCALPTVMLASTSFLDIGLFRLAMNYLCVAAVYGLCLAVTGRIKPAVALASGLLLLLAVINGFVYQFRGNLLKPTDILFVRTAMLVVGQYAFRIREGMAHCFLIWAWMLFAQGSLPKEDWIPRTWVRLIAAVAAVACAAVFWNRSKVIKMNTWGKDGLVYNGYYLNFAAGLRDFFIEEPETYGPEAIAQLESAYPEEAAAPEKRPNIIVIMNESFADLRVLGGELRTNQPVMPFVDSLQENTIRGYALTSIFGGTTANAEFEFLTGLSMANVPNGGCPYQQYIRSEISSLPRLLEGWGYRTFATHPYRSDGWNRVNAYNYIGFEEVTFQEAYPRQTMVREYISDREMYGYVLDALDAEQTRPLFLFGITMQNHGDYIYDGPNYEQTIFLEGYSGEYPMAEQYLSLVHESDKAVEYLLTELEACPEDTLVLFFGDHLPQIESDFLQELHGGEYETLAEQQLQYMVPFFLWANYDIEEQEVDCTSLNYLGRYVLEAAGLELPPFYSFLAQLEQAVPSVNAEGYYSVTAGTYLPLDKAQGGEADWLQQYACLQYNSMFDRENRSEHFFGKYLPQK